MSDESLPTRSLPPADITNPDQLIRVEDDLLVVPSGCVLPPICVVTNEPVAEQDVIQTELFWCSPWVLSVYFLCGPLLLIFFYFIAREHCTITYGISPSISNRTTLRKVGGSLLAIVLLVATVFLAAANYSAWLFVPTGILFVVALVTAVANRSPLSIVKCRNGMFWIKGFRPDYLEQLPLEA